MTDAQLSEKIQGICYEIYNGQDYEKGWDEIMLLVQEFVKPKNDEIAQLRQKYNTCYKQFELNVIELGEQDKHIKGMEEVIRAECRYGRASGSMHYKPIIARLEKALTAG